MHTTDLYVPGLLLEGRVGGALWGGGSGEWVRTKLGYSLRTYHPDLHDPYSSSAAGATTHGLYVPLELFHFSHNGAETFVNTGLGYRYTRTTEDTWYLIDGELDYTLLRSSGRNGLGALVAAEFGWEKLFFRVDVGLFHAESVDSFSSTFRATLAVGWSFGNKALAHRLAP